MLYKTYARINLRNLKHNLAGIRERVGERKIMLALKADAYGHGAKEVARFVEEEKLADWLGVATVPEGIELRAIGVKLPILKFTPSFPDELLDAINNDISLTVADETTITEASAVAGELELAATVQLAVDTGMRRIGCYPEHAIKLAQRLSDDPNLFFEGVFTHLPISDHPDGDSFTICQLRTFRNAVDSIQRVRAAAGLEPLALVHASNSAAVLGHSLEGLTLVRPGIMAYGYYPDPLTPRSVDLLPVMTLYSKVSFIKQVRAGDTVGYGRTWEAPNDSWIATVPVGYADGFSRLNSNRGRMLINGRSYPVVGRVCMDQTMLDLGSEKPSVSVGDDVVWLGCSGDESIDAAELAELMGTIPYEVTSLITPRVQRVYVTG
ncbi:MAG: alanine racemase [Propionibacteriaceae bacterium]|jgi:alanine racemase|nr:alanine racemase [Propionibacteriaceae bacterium]